MSLPSQMARTSPGGRAFVYKRRRRAAIPPGVMVLGGGAALLALVAVAVTALLRGGPKEAKAETPADAAEPVVRETTTSIAARGGGAGSRTAGGATGPAVTPAAAAPASVPALVPASRGPGAAGGAGSGSEGGAAGAPVVIAQGGASRAGVPAGGSPAAAPVSTSAPTLAAAVQTAAGGTPATSGTGTSGTATNGPATNGTAGGARAVDPSTAAGSSGAGPQGAPGTAGAPGAQGAPGAGSLASGVSAVVSLAERKIAAGDAVAARTALNRALLDPATGEQDRGVLRARLTELNQSLVFGKQVAANDTIAERYTVQSGDVLEKIARKRDLATDWRLIQRVNGISDPRKISVGQTLKLVRGPFHAIVDKSEYRMDVYQGSPDEPSEWTYIRSFPVGLGAENSTPVGRFVVRPRGKDVNPSWVNPRNPAEKYGRDDPMNPIGEFWVGLDGLGEAAAYTGYGVHGTIDPESIGTQASMGCVRMGDDEIATVYELLQEGVSLVVIQP